MIYMCNFHPFSWQKTCQKPQFVDDCTSELASKKNWLIFPAKISSLYISAIVINNLKILIQSHHFPDEELSDQSMKLYCKIAIPPNIYSNIRLTTAARIVPMIKSR